MRTVLIALMLMMAAMSTANAAVYQQGIVYVIYETEGDKAFKNQTDLNENGVPDVAEDIATQINATRELFHDVFKYPDPLGSARYENVHAIEVDIDSKKNMKVSGLAYSGVRNKSRHDPKVRALHVKIANTVDPRKNATPEHEYFHLIQYNATYFTNKWFLEGMARWSQDAVSKNKKYPDGRNVSWILKNKLSETQIFQGKYNVAGLLWYPFAVGVKDKAKVPKALMKKYKYVDGSDVFHDNIVYGANVMLEVLQTMKSKEAFAGEQFGGLKQWRSKGRRAAQNNKIILDCVREVYEKHSAKK